MNRSQIENAVRKAYNLTVDQVDLYKCEGFWYWGGELALKSSEGTCTFMTTLNSVNLDYWINAFKSDILDHIE